MSDAQRSILADLFQSGVSAVKGDVAVETYLRANDIPQPTKIIAAGKAAVAMFLGLPTDWQATIPTLLITKTDHIGDTVLGPNVTAIEASHPVPNATSVKAGQLAMDLVAEAQPDDRLLLLVSGGASALVEHLSPDATFEELVKLNKAALGDGADIAEINRRRKEISAIKGGQLLSHFKGADVDVLAISDVRGDSIDVIGSGIGAAPAEHDFSYSCTIVASNSVAREKVFDEAKAKALSVQINTENLYADVAMVAADIAKEIAQPGLYIFGGEPTVVLPENPGQGGRNQALALELARHFQGHSDICGLVAGTDGTDGPTVAAGGYFDGQTFASAPGAADALLQADSGSHLARVGDQFITGPTGTNVMDLVLVLKS